MSYRNRGVKIPRPRRIKFSDPRKGWYHIVSRALQKEFRFKDEEKKKLLELMKWLSQIYFVKIATFTILDTHFHMVLQMIREDDIPAEELRARLENYYRNFDGLPLDIKQAFEEANLDDLYAHFSDISMFMWDLKLRFARWYNKKHKGYGHVWAERFTSVLIVGTYALRACLIYVELNSVRAKIVSHPESYQFSGLNHLLKGRRHAAWLDVEILKKAIHGKENPPSATKTDLVAEYQRIVYLEGMNQNPENQSEKLDTTASIERTTVSSQPPSIFLTRIPAMTRGVFLSDARTCAILYEFYATYFRARKRLRRSKPIIETARGPSAQHSPDYLKDLHSLPPPKPKDDDRQNEKSDGNTQ